MIELTVIECGIWFNCVEWVKFSKFGTEMTDVNNSCVWVGSEVSELFPVQ